MTATRTTRQYLFHGLHLRVSGSTAVQQAMQARLRYFPAAPEGRPDLQFEFLTLERGEPHPIARPAGRGRPLAPTVDQGFDIEYFEATDELYANYRDDVRLLCDMPRARVDVSIAYPEAGHVWAATHPMFVLPLFELLKRRDYFNVHAAALSVSGKALLFVGHSGAGKSTLVAGLCRAGFSFMSDDYTFVARRGGELRVLAFPEELDLREHTAHLFPELRPAFDVVGRPGWVKRQARVEDYWEVSRTWEAAPAVLVFPTVADAEASCIEPMDAREAVTHLVSNVQYTQPRFAQAHVDMLAALVRESACYRLKTGRDFAALAETLRGLVDATPVR